MEAIRVVEEERITRLEIIVYGGRRENHET